MKKGFTLNFLFAIVLGCLVPKASFAQTDIKLIANKAANLMPEISFETGSENFSVELSSGIILKKWGDATVIDSQGNETEIGTKRFGFNGMLKANYYFNPDEGLDGWHISPYARYCYQKIKFTEPVANNRIGLGLMVGRKKMVGDSWGYQVEIGGGYWLMNRYKNTVNGEKTSLEENVPLIGGILDKITRIDIPFNVSVFYNIGGR